MKKIFLCIISVFLVLSASLGVVAFVNETTYSSTYPYK